MEKDGTVKMHLSAAAINVKSPREITTFIKSECVENMRLSVCVCETLNYSIGREHFMGAY